MFYTLQGHYHKREVINLIIVYKERVLTGYERQVELSAMVTMKTKTITHRYQIQNSISNTFFYFFYFCFSILYLRSDDMKIK